MVEMNGIGGGEDLEIVSMRSDHTANRRHRNALATSCDDNTTIAAASIDLHEKIVHAVALETDARTPGLVHAHDRHRLARTRIISHRDIGIDHGLPESMLMSMVTPRDAKGKEALGSTRSDHHFRPTPTPTLSKP
jgi:hypothetical protein